MFIKEKNYVLQTSSVKMLKKQLLNMAVTAVCEDEESTKEPDMILSANENCENLKETVSKYGVSVVCED